MTEGQSIYVTCRTDPRKIITRWSYNGRNLSVNSDRFNVLGRFNHTLHINNPTLENKGTYTCHTVGINVKASLELIVKPGTVSNDSSSLLLHHKHG